MARCAGFYGRHWFIAPRTIGLRTPVCIRCGSPNPRRLTESEWGDLIDWARDHSVSDHVRSALEAKYGG